jgi:DNA-binding beta-propeller fold protein YncE
MRQVSKGKVWHRCWPAQWTLVLAVFLAFGVTVAAPKSDDKEKTYLFYPPAPDEPRLQYLTKFASLADVSTKNTSFRDLVFGGEEFEEKLVTKPYGVAIFQGALYVVDIRDNGYAVFDFANGTGRKVKGSGQGAMKKPINITIDKNGTRYITDTERNLILEFDNKDRFVRTLGEADQFKPADIAIVDDRLYVTDIENNQVHVLDKMTGDLLFKFGGSGTEEGQLAHPASIAVGPDETLYVTEMSNFRIQHFTLDGESIRTIGQIGNTPGSFARPKGVALDREGRIYVVDAAFGNVQVLDVDGSPLTFFGKAAASGPGGIYLPTAVKLDYDNVEYFQKYAAPGFKIEYLVLVASQFGQNKVAVFGFGSAESIRGEEREGGP